MGKYEDEMNRQIKDAVGKYEDEMNRQIKDAVVKGVVIVVGVLIFVGFISSIRIINTGEVGILLQFGEMIDVLHPGLHFVVPFISSVEYMNTQTMKYEVSASSASKDLQIVSTIIAVNYHIEDSDDGEMYLFRQFKNAHEERLITPLVQEAVKANTAKFTAEDLIQRRPEIKAAIADTLTTKLAEHHISVDEVSITNFDFSDSFNNAIEAKVVVEQEKLKAQLELDKKKIEVQKMVAEQNATAEALVIQANADAQAKMLRAEGNAKATLIEAQANKEAIDLVQSVLSDEYIRYEYAKNWNGELPYLMGDNGFLLNLGIGDTDG